MCVVGGVIIYFAVENYIKVSDATSGTTIRMPRILGWSYDTLGFLPSVIIQCILGGVITVYGLYKMVSRK